jgi:hypothetical protein
VLIIATARPPRSVQSIQQALGIVGPTINYNGAVIWNPVDDHPQFHEPMAPDIARSVIEEARRASPDVLVGIEVLNRWFTDRIDPGLEARSSRLVQPDDIGPLDNYLASPVTQINLYSTPASIAAVRQALQQTLWNRRMITLFQPEPTLLQVSHPMVDKAIALQRIAQRTGVSRDAVMAIGNGAADKGMIEWAGTGIALANATDDVKALANEIMPANDDNGVARAIQRYVLSPA